MRRQTIGPVAAAILLSSAACYHATVDTGAAPSSQTVSKSFASGWIYGLVPPSTVETAARCPNGVAKVETELSFVNMLVSSLTFGIYTPMNIQVTCAATGHADASTIKADTTVSLTAGTESVQAAFKAAADQAVAANAPVIVRVRD